MTKIIFFDAAGTLFHLPRGVGAHYREVAARHGVDLTDAALGRAFGQAWKAMPARESTEGPRPDDDRGWWQALVERVLDLCEVNPAQIDRPAFFAELYTEFTLPGVWELFPEVPEVLAALRQRYRLGIISNFDGRLRPILQHLGLSEIFDPLIVSSEVGADKPAPRIFARALSAAGVRPEEALHVGDDPEKDWQGAAAAGLQVFQLDRPRNSLRNLLALPEL